MKYIKTYELIDYKYQIGEYVICKDEALDKFTDEEDTVNFLTSNIGQIKRYTNFDDQVLSKYKYIVIYENVPRNITYNFQKYNNDRIGRAFSDKEIIAHSPNKEDLEIILQQNKYNL